jgi:ribonuclease HI
MKKPQMKRARMYADGGSRGNPGPSASGAVIFDLEKGEEGDVLAEVTKFLGNTTNNQAEYMAIVIGLRAALKLGIEGIEVRLDSELAVKQLNGIYRVRNKEIAKRFAEVDELRQQFREIRFLHIRREFNTVADSLVNQELDKQS